MDREKILERAEELKEELISIRRDIHAYPEVGLQEERTSKIVAQKLRQLGYKVQTKVGITGVVGLLEGRYPGKTILLRADMDCLKMMELNQHIYKSKHDGLMHACGHDAHTAWLIGAAMILASYKDQLYGNVKFVFQPAEETDGGAKRMIADGVLKNPDVDIALAAHVWPSIESGKIGIKTGTMMAALNNFKVTVYGKGGHGAEPHFCIDPISVSCQIYMALQTIISRRINPVEPAVISIGEFHGGAAHNVIPDKVIMEGTVRTTTEESRKKIHQMIETIIKGITEAHGASYSLEYNEDYSPVINDEEITKLVEEVGISILGEKNVLNIQEPTMGGEDFAYFQQKVPGAFFVVGTNNPHKGIDKPLHSPYFDIDEDILPIASAVFAGCVLQYLNKMKNSLNEGVEQ
ncbi:M20 metallopeptidase family protein [Alkaliphilus peptidifermentans]|uniref:Amidohydrolase n=1 Tax=Alkaliphilus peptidifermentans DSM 18978 TaxID=1120976 RepID=A0A1G5KRE4_9FIRM|nr:M20 family metallopeptidase [Alkaliphilus peptidifermentans]SCZ03175.1 amidohydrolase [Alkaliphilus peptidifermentans DSM 18978]